MPGPKMGPRPPDFNEASLKQSPTYVKWCTLQDGEKLRYACREFIKGHEQDDERLLRRIMIARRNNIRDHETLKVARQRANVNILNTAAGTMIPRSTSEKIKMKSKADPEASTVSVDAKVDQLVTNDLMDIDDATETAKVATTATTTGSTRTRRPPHTFSDAQIEQEMDVAAVIKTRSYRSWLEVKDGGEFVYNQKYIKGGIGQDWLLRKNIWRRMRYRRENKQLVLQHHRQDKNTTGERSDHTEGYNTILHTSTTAPLQQRQLRSSSSITSSTAPTGVTVKIDMDTDPKSLEVGDDETIKDTAHLDVTSTSVGAVTTIAVDHNNGTDENTDDTTTASAAAIAAVAASLADEAAVEAAVAAAESHFHLQQQQQQEGDEEIVVDIDISESDAAIAAAVAVAAAVVATNTATLDISTAHELSTNTNVELDVDEVDDVQGVAV